MLRTEIDVDGSGVEDNGERKSSVVVPAVPAVVPPSSVPMTMETLFEEEDDDEEGIRIGGGGAADDAEDELDLFPGGLELPLLRSPRGSLHSLYSNSSSRRNSNCSVGSNSRSKIGALTHRIQIVCDGFDAFLDIFCGKSFLHCLPIRAESLQFGIQKLHNLPSFQRL
jgi:hypothetical protein